MNKDENTTWVSFSLGNDYRKRTIEKLPMSFAHYYKIETLFNKRIGDRVYEFKALLYDSMCMACLSPSPNIHC